MARGAIVLTEGRSGSSWLGGLSTATGVLGNSSEWFDRRQLGLTGDLPDGPGFLGLVIERASTPNGFFCFKLFPRHLHWFNAIYGFDGLLRLIREQEVLLVRLRRRDVLGQAISFAKARQSGQWSADLDAKRKPAYDFEAISRSYFHIRRAEAFWTDYCALRGLEPLALVYEDLVADPLGYLRPLADWAGVPVPEIPADAPEIQRNAETEAWRSRFVAEAREAELLDTALPSRLARSPLYRFLRRARLVKPGAVPYAW